MSSSIQILEDRLINKIAAGEVIESPISVIKELVENSIDAKANNINIEVKGSGLQLIKIEDDGIGMSKEDALLCFQRHATSKIKTFEDLIKITSMGFRGEALASIAAIAGVELKTSQSTIATTVVIDASKIIDINEVARTRGTTIEVKSLFYNVPVRKKFQKTLAYMNSQIIKVVTELALSHPNIGFTLILNEKKIFSIRDNREDKKISFKKRIKDLLFNEFVKSSTLVDFKMSNIEIYGLIGNPNVSKKTKSLQHLIVNNRVIKSHLISKFIKDAYATRIARDDFPVFVLQINVPTHFIDVNVHPQKKEIRIRENIFIKNAIEKAIDQTFVSNLQKEDKTFPIFVNSTTNFEKTDVEPNKDFSKENIFEKFERQMIFEKFYDVKNKINNFLQMGNYLFIDSSYFKNIVDFEDDEKMIIIDLSAIFTFLLFEKIKNKKSIAKMQNLLIPLNIDLSSNDLIFIEQNHQIFLNLAFDIRIVSKNSIAIDAIPEIIKQDSIKDLFFVILEDLKNDNKTSVIDQAYEKQLAKSLARLSKQKKYSKEEATNLLNIFIEYKNMDFDPLGNPVIVKLNKNKIEKLFK